MNLLRRSKTILLVLFLISAGITMLSALGSPGGTGLAKTAAAQEIVINYLPAVLATEGGIPPVCYKLTITREGEGSYPTALPTKSAGCQDEHTYYQGHTIILSGAVPMTGWAVSGWTGTIDDGIMAGTNAVEMPSGDHTAGVNYALDNVCYDLTLAHTGEGSDPVATPLKSDVCVEEHSYLSGELIQLSGAAPANDWYIAGWEGTGDDGSTADSNTVTMPAGSHTAKVNYAENCYILTISHTGMGSDPVATPSKSVTCALENSYVAGEEIQLSGAVPDLNWHITGWLGTDDDLSTADSSLVTMPMADHAVSVDYAETCYVLTLDHTGQGSDPQAAPLKSAVCEQDNSYVAGELISLSGAVPAAEWFIGTWNGTDNDRSNASTNTATMPGADHTVAVNYAESCYRLTIYHTGQGSDPLASPSKSAACDQNGTYVPGEKIDLIDAVPSAGWEVGGWSGTDDNGSTSDNNRVTMPASNRSAAVNYVRACYTLTTTHSGNGADPIASPTNSSLCALGTYTAGAAITLSAAPDPGWIVDGWSGTNNNSSTANNNTVTMPAQNHTAGVTYKGTCFALTIGKTGQGTVPNASPPQSDGCTSGKYTAGESIQFTAAPANHWFISGWTGTDNNSSTDPTNSWTMTNSAHSVTVIYEQCHQLTLSHTGQGSDPVASPTKSSSCDSTGYFVEGATINLSGAAPAADWAIKSWTGTDSDSSTAATNTVTMPAAARAAAVNYEQCYSLTLSHIGQGSDPAASPTKSSTCANVGDYVAGEAINLSGAVPDATWAIVGWTGTDNNSSTAATNSLIMPIGVHTATVIYEQPCYALTLTHTGSGTDPSGSPSHSGACAAGEYVEGQVINLNGASADAGWVITGWTGTDDDSSTNPTNKVTMPGNAHTATVIYEQCHQLTLGHTGQGSDPGANPTESAACGGAGEYLEGEAINFSDAVPDSGWAITGWTGTDNNISTAATNSMTMPNGAHSVTVIYEQPCYSLTLGHSGQGSDPVANPSKSSSCSNEGDYVEGEAINLSGAVPDATWAITGWTGTNNNSLTTSTNTTTMPGSAHSVTVIYEQPCYSLTIGHSGNGTDPTASPPNSATCSAGNYVEGEAINFSGAVPDANWAIKSWTGTDNNSSTAATNTVTMPGSAHSATVLYEQCYQLTLGHTGQGTDPVAAPTKSATCNSTSGFYIAGQLIGLSGAVPAPTYGIFGWTGTLNDLSVLDTNTATMPASAHAVGVTYELTAVQDEGYQFYLYYRWR